MKEKYTINDQYYMLISGVKSDPGSDKHKTTMAANGDIQLYYNYVEDIILIVDKNKMLKLTSNDAAPLPTIFGAMVQRLVLGDYGDCWEFHDGFLDFHPDYREYLGSLREMYVGSKKFAMNA